MKPYFDQDGHLTGRAFDDLLHGEPDELARLEIAEHLAFCDHCTERYTARLCEDELLPAPETLRPSVMRSIPAARRAAVLQPLRGGRASRPASPCSYGWAACSPCQPVPIRRTPSKT